MASFPASACVSQFRCNGSDGYLAWLDDVLGIRETANYDLNDMNYEFMVMNSSEELRQKVVERNAESNTSPLKTILWICTGGFLRNQYPPL